MPAQKLTLRLQIAYACGMMGWSIMINLIGVILVYMYLPPVNSGLPIYVYQGAVLGIFNVIALITSGGRLVDAIYDPFIAQLSDSSKNPNGRRIPFMKKAIIPSVLFCFLVFFPLNDSESLFNIFWLVFALIAFYVSSTTYIIPYNALLAEIAKTPETKVSLASWQSAGFVFGIGISSNAFNLCKLFQQMGIESKIHALQFTIGALALLGGIFMLITTLAINEKELVHSKPGSIKMMDALKQTLSNKNFQIFIVADFSYFVSVTLITSGLMFFVKVLLDLDESYGNKLMITMVLVSFLFYPVTNFLVPKMGKKKIVMISFLILAFAFSGIFFLGRLGFSPVAQIFALVAVAAIPVATLNILPNAIIADLIQQDISETGQNKEAVYYAVRYFFVKIAQTLGIGLFSMLLLFGKDPGDDLGIRLNGALGFLLCLIAVIIFARFSEKKKSQVPD